MTSLEIAEMTGKNHRDVMKAIRRMEDAWEKVNGRKFALVKYTDSKGERRPCYSLNKTECLYIATKFNDEARAKLVLRWEELETINNSVVSMRAKAESGEIDSRFLRQQIEVATFAMDSLKMSDASRLLVVSKICEPYNIALPDYVQSNGVIKSATELLKENNSTMSIYEFNRRMVEKGYLTVCERKSSKGVKKFKSLTEKGCEFGENCVSKYNINETQPEYYSDKFATLLSNL